MQSLELTVVITLSNFKHISLAIMTHLGRILTRKIMLDYIQK